MKTTETVQVKVITGRNGKRKAAYRFMTASGKWSPHWHHVIVADALEMQKAGFFNFGTLGAAKIVTG